MTGPRPVSSQVTVSVSPQAAFTVPWIFVDDLDAHFARARAAGVKIVEPIHQHGYRAYLAEDLGGHRWTFAQARPTMR
ncbi:MAG TPA: VOC family protein [Streptosporangiaceae bacterium]|nr:VOC family protein [Streptosporangiaceae bacterium]